MGLVLKIADKRFIKFSSLKIDLNYASIDSVFSFNGLYDDSLEDHKTLFKPLTYPTVKIETEDGERILSGTSLSNVFTDSPIEKLSSISGHTRCGVLGNVNVSPDNYPLEFNGLSLFQIAEKLCAPYSINVYKGNESDKVDEEISEISIEHTQSIGSFLSTVAAQKGLVITHTKFSNIVFEKASTKTKPKAVFTEGSGNTGMRLMVNGQAMHSEITVLRQASLNTNNAGQSTIINPYVAVYRPVVKKQNSGTNNDTEQAARRALGNELENIVLTIDLSSWYWPNTTEIVDHNSIIEVMSPKLHLFNRTVFFVKSVSLMMDTEKGETSRLTCVLPEVYNSDPVKNVFEL